MSQILASPPAGFKKITANGETGLANQITFISIGISRPSTGQYVVGGRFPSAEGRSTLPFESFPFVLYQFNQVASPRYVQIAKGANVGTIFETIDTRDGYLSLSDNIQDVIVPRGSRVQVVPYWTPSSTFPMGADLGTGLRSASADDLIEYDP